MQSKMETVALKTFAISLGFLINYLNLKKKTHCELKHSLVETKQFFNTTTFLGFFSYLILL